MEPVIGMEEDRTTQVLVIAGDAPGRRLLVDLLQHAGYRVEAEVGAAAVAQLVRARSGVRALLVSSFPDQAVRARAQRRDDERKVAP